MSLIRTGCKINLGLRITGKRPDGYHELNSLFYPLPYPSDTLDIRLTEKPGLSVQCAGRAEEIADNILFRVWEKFPNRPAGVAIRLIKRIPVGSGLGGGSADAAAFLAWLNQQRPLPEAELTALAAATGADVPFFLQKAPRLVTGIGERLEPVRFQGEGFQLVLVWPGVRISTAWAFAAHDRLAEKGLTKEKSANTNSNSAWPHAGCVDVSNDLELPVFAEWYELADLKRDLLRLGAISAAMSGSGSAIYGVFADPARAAAAARALRQDWPEVYCLRMSDSGM